MAFCGSVEYMCLILNFLQRATKFDEGSYVCFAYNVKISVTSETALLNVIGKHREISKNFKI